MSLWGGKSWLVFSVAFEAYLKIMLTSCSFILPSWLDVLNDTRIHQTQQLGTS